jgi:hypothetical protein
VATTTRKPPATSKKPAPKTEESDSSGARPEQVLTISTLAPTRPFIVIDDVQHDFKILDEFGEREHQEWVRDSSRYEELWRLDEPTEDQVTRRQELLDELVDRTLVKPKALHDQVGDRLTGPRKREIVLAFSNARSLIELNKQAIAQQEQENIRMEEFLSGLTS